MINTLLLTEHDLAQWSRRYRRGEVPAPMPYGVDALGSLGFGLRGPGRSTYPLAVKARDMVDHRLGYPVEGALRGIPATARAGLVLALLERQGMAAAVLKRRRIPPYRRTPLVIWSCWLADDLRTASPETRRALVRRVAAADLITHLSRHESDIFAGVGIHPDRLFPVTYGVSHRFYTPDPTVARDIGILAVGQDRGRDYQTLVDAVRGTDLTLDIVTRPDNLAGIDLPPNVRAHGTVSLPEYRRLLRRAQVVAVPTRDLAYPTGSSVALEAASSGCAVAVTGTRAMRDYFSDDVDAVLVGEGDVEGWRTVLRELRDDPDRRARLGSAARLNVEHTHNADHMWRELAEVLRARGVV